MNDDDLFRGLRGVAADLDRAAARDLNQLLARGDRVGHRSRVMAVALVVAVAAAVGLIAFHSDDGTETTTTGPDSGSDGESACSAYRQAAEGDVDGDGAGDLIFAEWVNADDTPSAPGRGDYAVGVCTASGRLALSRGTVSESLGITVANTNGGRSAEILVKASDTTTYVFVLDKSQLRPVTVAGEPLELTALVMLAGGEGGPPIEMAAFGCEDVAGDQAPEVVQIANYFDTFGHLTSSARRAYVISGAEAHVVLDEESHEPDGPVPELEVAPCTAG